MWVQVGCLLYPMVYIKLDLTYAIRIVSKFLDNPENEHWQVVNRYFDTWEVQHIMGLIFA